jgi:1-acyl-sn-glycerol-3-phosphate acyltransferase
MEILTTRDAYHSSNPKISALKKKLAGWIFYPKMISIVWKAARLSKRGRYPGEAWVHSSRGIVRALESVGVDIKIDNLSAFQNLDSPCVFVGNHMSTLETFVLPCVIRPYRAVTFIVKEELIEYPVFKHVMIHCDPVVVGRTNPREDFKIVMEEGKKRLDRNISMVVFPQTTRRLDFDARHFNTIGVKLAQRAGVPIVPFALKTDAWGNGKWIKDFGKIYPDKPVYIHFGDPIVVEGRSKETHESIVHFIEEKLAAWN